MQGQGLRQGRVEARPWTEERRLLPANGVVVEVIVPVDGLLERQHRRRVATCQRRVHLRSEGCHVVHRVGDVAMCAIQDAADGLLNQQLSFVAERVASRVEQRGEEGVGRETKNAGGLCGGNALNASAVWQGEGATDRRGCGIRCRPSGFVIFPITDRAALVSAETRVTATVAVGAIPVVTAFADIEEAIATVGGRCFDPAAR